MMLLVLACRSTGAPPYNERDVTASGGPQREHAILDVLLAHHNGRARPAEVKAAIGALERNQHAALSDLPRGRFVFVRMNPAAGLGNRLVAMVSGLFLAAATERGFLVDWEPYDEPRTHRSKEHSQAFTAYFLCG